MTIYEYAKESFSDTYDIALKESSKRVFYQLSDEFGLYEVKAAIDIACEQYEDPVTVLYKIHGILVNRAKVKEVFIEDSQHRRNL